MIKNSLINFFKNFVYLFITMGIFYLFLLITIFALTSAFMQSLGEMITQLSALVQASSGESSATVNEFLAYSLQQIEWNGNLWDTLVQIFSSGWIGETLRGFFQILNTSTEGFEQQFTAIVGAFTDSLKAFFSVAVALLSFGITAASYATRFAIRRRTVKRGLKKFLIAHTVVPFVQAVVVLGALVLLAFFHLYSLPLFLALLILSGAVSLISSWLIHRNDQLKLKEVLTLKNIFNHLAVLGILLAIDIVVAVVLYLISPLLAILLMIPFMLYSMNIADLDTDCFICDLVQQKENADP